MKIWVFCLLKFLKKLQFYPTRMPIKIKDNNCYSRNSRILFYWNITSLRHWLIFSFKTYIII